MDKWSNSLTHTTDPPFRPSQVRNTQVLSKHVGNLHSFTGHLNSKQLPLEASFSPDSQFVISGSSDGRIHIWNSENGQKVCVLNGDHKNPVQCVQVSVGGCWVAKLTHFSLFSLTRSTWWWPQHVVLCPFGYQPLKTKCRKWLRHLKLLNFINQSGSQQTYWTFPRLSFNCVRLSLII